MTRSDTLAGTLVLIGVVLLVGPALLPLQPALYHNTNDGIVGNESEIERLGYEVVAYENLSERGQELYVKTLRSSGRYTVPKGAGASDFAYPTGAELEAADGFVERNELSGIAIARPSNADLPPADEPVVGEYHRGRVDNRDREATRNATERQKLANRYDLMTTRTGVPPLTAPRSLFRLFAAAAGILVIGVGGYLRSKP